MANYWAIAIGINQYEFFQPLGYAQADAEELRNFLVQEAELAPEHCLLMTDTSPPIDEQSTCPTQENVQRVLQRLLTEQLQPEDKLLLLFSGYGVYDSTTEQDYLMPVEGHPDRVVETGIEVRSLFQNLQAARLSNVLVLFDINRAASQVDSLVGKETIELAQELEIPTILSCRPEEFSGESAELGHGFFTFALLEAWRAGFGSTLGELQRYLSERLPELSQHNLRPLQNPVTIIEPPELANELILQHFGFALTAQPQVNTTEQLLLTLPQEELETPTPTYIPAINRSSAYSVNQPRPPVRQVGAQGLAPLLKFLLLLGSGLILLGLFWGVFFRNRPAFQSQQAIAPNVPENNQSQIVETLPNPPTAQTNTVSQPSTTQSQPASLNSPSSSDNQLLLDQARMSIKQNQASGFSRAIATARKIPPGDPLYQQAQPLIDRWSHVIFDLAQGRAKQGQFADAIAAAELIAKDLPISSQAQQAIGQWRIATKQQVINRTLLDAATGLIVPGQASTLNRAIVVASKVPPGQPVYPQAQKAINNWSQSIFAIADRRADNGYIKAAIETATLVPPGTAAYPLAQQAIQKWNKQLTDSRKS